MPRLPSTTYRRHRREGADAASGPVHERLAFFYLQRYGAPFGLPYSCVNNARLLPELAQADPISYEHPEWLREGQYRAVLSDPTWCQAYEAALVEARAAYTSICLP